MLDATRLRVLVAIARHGSVTAAAQVLNYAQPSISHHMARLESETGAKLMERCGRGIRLTEAGRLLAERAEAADALRMLRVGAVDVALIFRYSRDTVHQDRAGSDRPVPGAGDPLNSDDLRYHAVLDEPVYLITPSRAPAPAGVSLLADCAV